jgi:hypothetical protein
MADNTQPKPDEEEVDYVGELAAMKKTRKTMRRQITLTSNQIDTLTNTQGSRGAIQGLKLPVLRLFDGSQPVVVSVDASPFGIGAVLMQEGQPVAFSSTTLTVTQKRYCQIEKKLLAVQYTNSVLLWSPIINRWLVCWTSLLLRARRGFNECGFNCNGLTSS